MKWGGDNKKRIKTKQIIIKRKGIKFDIKINQNQMLRDEFEKTKFN
jgi:hypothetical protein